ncbi:type II toxin-antitoxin system VapC family toxin [Pseudactinotalea sp. HY158]|uniref:type II toxin-antitoxin system VapC family toxin n=1 Tax=Pseudactinotalea sp. HY158 TaxID=2654547 RepID=UPI00129CAEC9|nr:type II toxin-antitoxin system VapC family toxin [Pseudactinotalea sp. HY158]QGH70222.1 PIN domain-containing protein [Pseudactinotalea sp. HY158]
MSFLLDTNVVSELRKRPGVVDPHVLAWAQRQPAHDLYVSVVTVLEIALGVARVERRDPRQGAVLREWMESGVLAGFAGRILVVDVDVALSAAQFHVPDPRPERDALIGATASVHGLTVVTRNVQDFQPTGVAVLDPWAHGR